MKNSIILKIILLGLGLILTVLGTWRLIDPITFFENSGLTLDPNVGIMSEARGTGGVVVGFGLLILLGAFIQKLSYTSTIAAIVLFLGFGIARLIGFAIDGNAEVAIIQGTIMEFIFGLLGVFAFFKFRTNK